MQCEQEPGTECTGPLVVLTEDAYTQMKTGAWAVVRSVVVIVPSARVVTSIGRSAVVMVVPVITVYRSRPVVRV